MLYKEFLEGIGKKHSEGTAYAYSSMKAAAINTPEKKKEAFIWFMTYKKRFLWLDRLDIGNGRFVTKDECLKQRVSQEIARELINEMFAFEIEKIKIFGTPYYECSDFNHIVFAVNGYIRVLHNGELYDVRRNEH